MSSESQPITSEAFALALKDLSVPIIYGKVFEIRNSLAHLKRSNDELQTYIDEGIDGKEELQEAIAENVVVMDRMQTRIELCRAELERRGAKWVDDAIQDKLGGAAAEGEAMNEAQTGAQQQQDEGDEGEEGIYL